MVYLIGTRNREYQIEGVIIPKKAYNEREIELGRKTVVEIDETVYGKLSANKIFQSLVKNGDVLVRDKAPEGQETMPELRQKLIKQQDDSAARIAQLMEEIRLLKEGDSSALLKEADAKYKALEDEALVEIGKRDKRIAQLAEALTAAGIEVPA